MFWTRGRRMKPGVSRLYDLQPDPYDSTQRKCVRVCMFDDVKNMVELREAVRAGELDAALIRAELVLEPFVLLAAANRAVHHAAHNRLSTRTLAAELIYSLSPSRNISDSLLTFGAAENSRSIVAAIFDDKSGDRMKAVAKRVKGTAMSIDHLPSHSNYRMIKKVYQVHEPSVNEETISDHIITRIITKDFLN